MKLWRYRKIMKRIKRFSRKTPQRDSEFKENGESQGMEETAI